MVDGAQVGVGMTGVAGLATAVVALWRYRSTDRPAAERRAAVDDRRVAIEESSVAFTIMGGTIDRLEAENSRLREAANAELRQIITDLRDEVRQLKEGRS